MSSQRSCLLSAFGQVIRVHRQNLRISQEELAWRAGLNRTYVTDVERGKRNPTLATIEKLAEALQTPMSMLLQEVELARASRPK